MPVIEITLIEGYDADARRRLSERLHDAACSVIAAADEAVTIVTREVAAASYMRGRADKTPGPALMHQPGIVKAYLAAMEARDLAGAGRHLAPGFTMTFPGGAVFEKPEQLVDWAKSRYRSVGKTYERFDFCAEDQVVYCFGTLQGEWPDGRAFSGIRFIDRFTLADNLITSQLVWNDLAEAVMSSGGA
jgi:phenylpyruvate tautomerase PptA (4-oxalocrotonate tautomerase family)